MKLGKKAAAEGPCSVSIGRSDTVAVRRPVRHFSVPPERNTALRESSEPPNECDLGRI